MRRGETMATTGTIMVKGRLLRVDWSVFTPLCNVCTVDLMSNGLSDDGILPNFIKVAIHKDAVNGDGMKHPHGLNSLSFEDDDDTIRGTARLSVGPLDFVRSEALEIVEEAIALYLEANADVDFGDDLDSENLKRAGV